MPDANDMDLVREFARSNSEAAFAELARRHINLVYSVALRFTGQPEDAQDVTQVVFIILSQKAPKLHERTVVPGASSAGGSRSTSQSTASVVPSSCQPPGEARG